MSRKTRPADAMPGLRLSPPELWRLHFTRHELPQDFSSEPPPLLFGLGLNRIAENRLGVELSVEIKDFPPLSVSAAYRSVFELDANSGTDIDEQLRVIAAQVGPAALYPFLRETITSVVMKAGLPPVVPPVVNFRSVFNPKEVALPPVREESGATGA